jgi:hypothetical protein
VIYERPTTDRICRIRQVVKAPALRWTFEAGMGEAAREALAVLWHEAVEQMVHSQYRHFWSRAKEGVKAVILHAGGHDHMGCFTDQVKLLGKHEESGQKFTELEALCKKLREDTQRLEEEKATLERMVESRDELLMEITREMGLDRMGEDDEEEDDADNRGDATAPPTAAAPPLPPLLPCLSRSTKKALWRWSLSKKPWCRMRSSWQMMSPWCHSSISTMHSWGTEENLLRLEDDFDDLDDDPSEELSGMDE